MAWLWRGIELIRVDGRMQKSFASEVATMKTRSSSEASGDY